MGRLVKGLMCFTAVNVAGLCIFYGWVLTNQFRVQKGRQQSAVIMGGGADTAFWETNTDTQSVWKTYGSSHKEADSVNEEKPVMTSRRKSKVLQEIPPVPTLSETDDVPTLAASIMKKYLWYPDRPANETVLILTPIHDVERKLNNYLHLLQSITYPHMLISVALGEDSSHDNTLHRAEEIAEELRKSFRRVDVFHFNITGQVSGSWSNVHSKMNQSQRRKHLAQARNLLLKFALRAHRKSHAKKFDWVLWIDSDIVSIPPDIIQQLTSADQDVVAPLCVYMDGRRKRVFDKNTWRETPLSIRAQKSLPAGEVIFEGYESTKRLWLSDLRAEGRVVPIDGVGGCTLLVRVKCHEKGLIFPEEPFQHHLETEGLAKMAKTMGFGVFGMPFVEVMH